MYITSSVIAWAVVFYVLIFVIGGLLGALVAFRIVNNYIDKEMAKAKQRKEIRKRANGDEIFHELEAEVECSKC